MNVLHVIPGIEPEQGGLRSALAGFTLALGAVGARSTIACVDAKSDPGDDRDFGSQAEVLRFAPSRPRLTRNSLELARWLQEHVRDFDAVLAHSLWLAPTRMALDAAHRKGVAAFAHPHGMLDPDAMRHHRWRKLVRWTTGEAASLSRARLIFSTDEEMRRARTRTRVRNIPAFVVPNAVDESFFAVKRTPVGHGPRILCLNRLHPRKGVRELIAALLLLRGRGLAFHAVIAGAAEDKRYAAALQKLARPLIETGRVEFLPLLARSRVLAEMAQADLLVHPATGYENFGMVCAEAMAAGVAVAASRRALLTPQLESAGAASGLEPAPRDIAATLEPLLADDKHRRELAAAGRDYAQRHFMPAAVGRRMLEVLSGK